MERRYKQIALASCLVAGLGAAAILFFFDPAHIAIYPVCTFHRLTGLDCPGCGGLRAAHQLLHGHLAAAWRFNAFLVLSLPVLAWLVLRLVRRHFRRDSAPVIRPLWLWVWLAAWMAFSVLRNLPVSFVGPAS